MSANSQKVKKQLLSGESRRAKKSFDLSRKSVKNEQSAKGSTTQKLPSNGSGSSKPRPLKSSAESKHLDDFESRSGDLFKRGQSELTDR